jgi:hypothetical protein
LSRDLPFKYLRQRTMVIVDLDGLTSKAMAEVIRGSRQGLYEGDVYYAIRDRLVSMLKKDADLDALQKDAERKYLEMDAGDEAVKNKLDQLIEGHHNASTLAGEGTDGVGTVVSDSPHFITSSGKHEVVVMGATTLGEDGSLPVLVTDPGVASIRLEQPAQTKVAVVKAQPPEVWSKLEDFTAKLEPEHKGLILQTVQSDGQSQLTVSFAEPDDMDEEEYPLNSQLLVFARFKGHAETRMLKIPVSVVKKKGQPPPPKPLRLEPTYLKVVSRQPIKLVPEGASVHVKLRWDGDDSLLIGSPPAWTFGAQCLSLSTFPRMGFANRGNGRLELLLDAPGGILVGSELEFEVVATGLGRNLVAKFKAVIVERDEEDEIGPRKIGAAAPNTAGQRRPPYLLKYVDEEKWDDRGCWEDSKWTGQDSGCFQEQTTAAPLIIVLNKDMALLKAYREEMVRRKNEENTIKERMNRYYSIVGFHLYLMYLDYKRKEAAGLADDTIKVPTADEMRNEISRAGTSIVRIMELSR